MRVFRYGVGGYLDYGGGFREGEKGIRRRDS